MTPVDATAPRAAAIAVPNDLTDAETGLVYLRARHYDPATGRFVQADPIGMAGGSTNFYTYGHNNPCARTDRSGLEPDDFCQRYSGFPGQVDIAANISKAQEARLDTGWNRTLLELCGNISPVHGIVAAAMGIPIEIALGAGGAVQKAQGSKPDNGCAGRLLHPARFSSSLSA